MAQRPRSGIRGGYGYDVTLTVRLVRRGNHEALGFSLFQPDDRIDRQRKYDSFGLAMHPVPFADGLHDIQLALFVCHNE